MESLTIEEQHELYAEAYSVLASGRNLAGGPRVPFPKAREKVNDK